MIYFHSTDLFLSAGHSFCIFAGPEIILINQSANMLAPTYFLSSTLLNHQWRTCDDFQTFSHLFCYFSTMAAAPKPLNPQAPEYIPIFNASFITPNFNIPPLIHDVSSSSILIPQPPAFPSSSIPLLHPNQPPLHLPSYIHNEPFYTDSLLLPQQSSYFPPLSPPPLLLPAPPQEDLGVPPSSPSAVSPPLAISEPVRKGPRVITHKKYSEPKFSRVRAGRGGSWLRGRGRGGGFGRDSSREWVRKRSSSSSSMHEEERKGDKSRTYVKKHGILPLRSCEEKTTVMIKNIPNEYTY